MEPSQSRTNNSDASIAAGATFFSEIENISFWPINDCDMIILVPVYSKLNRQFPRHAERTGQVTSMQPPLRSSIRTYNTKKETKYLSRVWTFHLNDGGNTKHALLIFMATRL